MHLTVADVAALLRTPAKQIYRWIDEGELGCNWFHDQPRFNRTELLEWATARKMPIAVEQFLDALFEFACGLVGEGHGQDPARVSTLGNQVRQTVGDHARFTRTGTSDDQ